MATKLSSKDTNEAIRAALREAAAAEGTASPFQLSGRGHEPRVTLDRSLAAILRGVDLPCVVISGYGANNYYPRRLFVAALELLRQRLGTPPISVGTTSAYRN